MARTSGSTRQRPSVGAETAIRRLFERVYSTGELSQVDTLVASDCTAYSVEAATAYHGPAGMKTHVSRLRTAFGGFSIEIDALRDSGDAVAVEWTARGRHERPFVGVEPTCRVGAAGEEPHGPQVVVPGRASGRFAREQLREWRMEWNVDDLRDRATHD